MLSDRLGTAQLQDPREVASNYPFEPGKIWLGRAEDGTAIGYRDDRHICLVSGTRGGKGTSIIINNLCLWPGSAVVIDPKGENATCTAARRGQGDKYCTGMGQDVHVLDPFNAATVDDCYRSSFNPLAGLDIEDEETQEEAHRIANALVIVHEDTKDGPWDEQARTLVRGLILHVLSADRFEDSQRNLLTVAELIQCGDQLLAETMRNAFPDKQIEQPHLLLFKDMQLNPAFGGRVARIGAQFRTMLENSAKQFQGVLQSATANTEFLDSPGMARVLSGEGRTFRLSELKTNPGGVTVYLSLPLRQLRNTHYRWLRMMIDLITTQMEITRGNPATGHPLLMWLDEFRALQRMDTLQAAAPYIAGFGMKLGFVVQTLAQLHEVYKDGWETFLGNAGLKLFFSIDDNFTRDYVSKSIGETELVRELQNFNESQSDNESEALGTSQSKTLSQSNTRGTSHSDTDGMSVSTTRGTSKSDSRSWTEGENQSETKGTNYSETEGTSDTKSFSSSFGFNQSSSWSRGSSGGTSTSYGGPNGSSRSRSTGFNRSESGSTGTSHTTTNGTSHTTTESASRGVSRGTSKGRSSSFTDGLTCGTSDSDTLGMSRSGTDGTSNSDTRGTSETSGTTQTRTLGTSRTAGIGRNQTIHRRPLLQPDEVGRHFARIDDKTHPRYPGLALVVTSGDAGPMIVRRVNYFEDPLFIDCFSPHPDHAFTPAVPYSIEATNLSKGERLVLGGSFALTFYQPGHAPQTVPLREEFTLACWHVLAIGQIVMAGQPLVTIERDLDLRKARIFTPCFGKVTEIAKKVRPASDGKYTFAPGTLITVKTYPDPHSSIDPFAEIRALPIWTPIEQPVQAPPPPPPPALTLEPTPARWLVGLGLVGVVFYFFCRLVDYLLHVVAG